MGKLDVDRELIRELAALLEETGLAEIEVQENDRRIRVARPRTQTVAHAPAVAGVNSPATPAAPAEEFFDGHPGALVSPMVGIVYRAPEPGAAPYVEIGDVVAKGDTVLMIEAMKTFNEIPAHHDGTIVRILVENAGPVEIGEVLVVIE